MKNNKQYFNPLPIDGAKNIQYDYNFDRMHKIIKWNEKHCDYWNGIDYQIEVHQKSIDNYDGGMGTLDWYDDLKIWDQTELQMLKIYRRDLAIRNILE